MALNVFKKLKEDMENNTTLVVGTVTKVTSKATSSGYAGTAAVAATGTSGSQL